MDILFSISIKGGRAMRRCWVNFQCRGVLLILIIKGKGPFALAVGAGWGSLDNFSLAYLFSFLSPSLGDNPIYTEILSQRTVKPKSIFSSQRYFVIFPLTYVRNKVDLGPLACETDPRND